MDINKEDLIKFLRDCIHQCNSSAEELIQEYGNKEDADRMSAMVVAYEDVLKFVQTKI